VRAHRLTMSRMARAHVCAFPFRIDVAVNPRPSGKEARIGNVAHHRTATHLKADVPPLAEEDLTIIAAGDAIFNGPLKTWLDTTTWTACEVGLLYSAAADACIDGPRRGEPGYDEVSAMELRGTLDLVRVEEDRIVLRDLKTGKPPTDREQLYAQAVAASRRWGKSVVEIGYVRALKTKVEELDVETLDADRLDEEAGRIARVLRRLPMAEPVVNDKCDWCDARGACPEYGAERAAAKLEDLEAAGFFG
jgi:hypothetical protein